MARIDYKSFDLYESSSLTAIDGPKVGTVTIPIQYLTLARYNEVYNATPVNYGGQSRYKALFMGTSNTDDGTLDPGGNPFNQYSSILDPYLWAAVVGRSSYLSSATWLRLLKTERALVTFALTAGPYLHITYDGSPYGYVVRCRANSDDGRITGFNGGLTRVHYLLGGTTTNVAPVNLMVQEMAGSYSGSAGGVQNGIVQGNLYPFFIDEEAQKLCAGWILVNLFHHHAGTGGWDYIWYHDAVIGWNGRYAQYALDDVNVRWLLQAPETSVFHYLVADQGGTLYNWDSHGLSAIPETAPSASAFRQYGPGNAPPASLLMGMENPRIYKWTGIRRSALPLNVEVQGIKAPNTVSGTADLTGAAVLRQAWAHAAGDVRIDYSLDGGSTWTDPIPLPQFLARKPEAAFPEMEVPGVVRVRLSLCSVDAALTDFALNWTELDPNAFDLDSFLAGVLAGTKLRLMDAGRRSHDL